MEKKELCNRFRVIQNSNASLENKTEECIVLYNESSKWNKTYCHSQIYKILGFIPEEIITSQQLLNELNELNDYDNLRRYLDLKAKKR